MSGSVVLWLVLTTIMFWITGLFKRLSTLRMQAMHALGTVDGALRQFARVVDEHLGTTGRAILSTDGSLVEEASRDWAELLGALEALENALKETRRTPLARASISRLGAALESVHSSWSQLCSVPSDLAGPAVPDAVRSQWDAASASVQSVRARFNTTMQQYNQAQTQFPARLVAGIMRFELSGLL